MYLILLLLWLFCFLDFAGFECGFFRAFRCSLKDLCADGLFLRGAGLSRELRESVSVEVRERRSEAAFFLCRNMKFFPFWCFLIL